MTRICGILTVAVALAAAGCTSTDMARQDQNPMDANRSSTSARYDQNRQDYYNPGTASSDINGSQNNRLGDNDKSLNNTSTYSNTSNTPNASEQNAMANNNANGANSAGPQLGTNTEKVPSAGISNADNRFINDAAAGGLYEVQSSEKALMKSTDTNIKNLAQHLIDDHTKANRQLLALASRKGVDVVRGPDANQVQMLAQLDKLNGTDFDREYLRQQDAAHKDAIDKFQNAANSANDKDLRDWAAATLPTLREHLQMAQNQENGTNINTGVGIEK